ncbi:MAG: hypothetical protein M3Q68_00895 [Actinomycetota bacterium]|nr:hypothetical protein [Actinomycetota bacterium]
MSEGLVDEAWWRARQDDYLRCATTVWVPHSPLNVIDHLERAGRDPAYDLDISDLDGDVVDRWCRRIDGWLDCADFDILRLLTLWYAYRDRLPAALVDGVERRLVGFRYWFTDPGPAGVVDERWYWSENHRLIFAVCEYLAGQAQPDVHFPVAGLTGAEHQRRAEAAILEWCAEKVPYGFSEWHSDAYYEKDLAPLVALAEFADDPAMVERASTFADLVLYDLALHSIRDNNGSTHGRSYMRFKATAPTQTVFSALKLCFDRTEEPWPRDDGDERELLPATEGATFLARCRRYRPPDVIRRVATSTEELVDREGMGVALDPGEPLSEDPQRADGLSYTDPDMVSFWWDRGALTPWQLVPLAFDTLERHQLWDSKLFTYFRNLRDAFGGDVDAIRRSAHGMHRMMNAGLLERVESYTWRNSHGMLSTAQSYRPGCAGYQHHISQATLDEHAVVFTTHPGGKPSKRAGDYLDHDRFWTGSATLPRAVQHRRVALHVYAPGFPSVEEGVLRAFRYTYYTHAYFPTERFDEVATRGQWTLGRRRNGYVALWSWRPAEWRHHDPAAVFTNGLSERFELVAAGGPENVWILEMGDADRWPTFEEFCEAIDAATVDVTDHGWGTDGAHLGFDVDYGSPAEGRIQLDREGALHVAGGRVAVDGYPRFDNPFTVAAQGEPIITIADGLGAFALDLAAGTRTWQPAPAASS